ncbi:hypothetical protein EV421DRAFT_1935727 [Armillaria borealis]|uniref:Uncharacterized protein n=1 Tax=Armillaria borealis TaxID=47425 RepID=A0AA39MDX7_9AGAR|nr:hypothetical protein EV421DRAFT_1935727 [Armillaria borealis]
MFPGSEMLELRLLPRTRLQGGFVMDRDTAIEWAFRIGNERLTKDDIYWVWELIEDKLVPYGSRFSFVGEELDAEFMAVTQTFVFKNGYLGMDPALIPQFKEGGREKFVRKLLAEEGLGHLEFSTLIPAMYNTVSRKECMFPYHR